MWNAWNILNHNHNHTYCNHNLAWRHHNTVSKCCFNDNVFQNIGMDFFDAYFSSSIALKFSSTSLSIITMTFDSALVLFIIRLQFTCSAEQWIVINENLLCKNKKKQKNKNLLLTQKWNESVKRVIVLIKDLNSFNYISLYSYSHFKKRRLSLHIKMAILELSEDSKYRARYKILT